MRWSIREVATPHGVARLRRAGRSSPGRATLVLGHGAGGGVEAADLQELAAAVTRAGHPVVLMEQPWRVAGRRVAPRPTALDEAWVAALRTLRSRGPLVVGGRSAGARVACRTAIDVGAAAVVGLAFPLHPPGRPERSRAAELAACGVPTLVIQGSRDPFGSAAEVSAAVPGVDVVEVPGADHALIRGTLTPAWERVIALLGSLGE